MKIRAPLRSSGSSSRVIRLPGDNLENHQRCSQHPGRASGLHTGCPFRNRILWVANDRGVDSKRLEQKQSILGGSGPPGSGSPGGIRRPGAGLGRCLRRRKAAGGRRGGGPPDWHPGLRPGNRGARKAGWGEGASDGCGASQAPARPVGSPGVEGRALLCSPTVRGHWLQRPRERGQPRSKASGAGGFQPCCLLRAGRPERRSPWCPGKPRGRLQAQPGPTSIRIRH